MASLAEKLLKNSTIKLTSTVDKSQFFKKKDLVQTKIPALNLVQSGEIDGGFGSGLTIFAGPSKHYKSGFVLTNLNAYLDKYRDSVALFYDSEFGTPQSYFMAHSIPMDRVIHTPITNIEELKFDLMNQLANIERGDKIFIAVDSVGNLASKKEVEDALNEKSVADMSRAKAFKSLFRMVTPHLTLKDIPMHVVSHTYDTMELYSKKVVSGGCVLPETLIKMADGSLKMISLIQKGEEVLTLAGPKEVTAVWDHLTLDDGEPECYEITFDDGYSVTCSDIHRFLDDSGLWVQANELSLGDQLIT